MPYKDPQKQKEAKRRYYLKNKYNITDPPKFPPIKIPENVKETQYPGYYIKNDGTAYRSPGKYDRYVKLNEYGLIPLSTSLRGNPAHTKYQYSSINVSLRDENGKYLRQKKVNIHRLVAEAFIPNPNNYDSVEHKDRNKLNNHVSNLEWMSIHDNKSSWERDKDYSKKMSDSLRMGKAYGIGINDVEFEGRHSPIYKRWLKVLKDCKIGNKTICEEWKRYSKFKSWVENQNLDKDSILYLIKGNEYCPENYVITSYNLINVLSFKRRGKYPLGVSLTNPGRTENIRYAARCGKSHHLGCFDTIEECHLEWQKHKVKEINSLIEKEKDSRVIELLMLVKNSIDNDIVHCRETVISPFIQQ